MLSVAIPYVQTPQPVPWGGASTGSRRLIRRMIGSPASGRAFQASQSPFTFRHTRLTVSLLIAPPKTAEAPGALDAYWFRQGRRRQSANRPA